MNDNPKREIEIGDNLAGVIVLIVLISAFVIIFS